MTNTGNLRPFDRADVLRESTRELNDIVTSISDEAHRRQSRIEKVQDIALADLASEYCNRLNELIADFDKSLDQKHEVGMRLVSYGQSIVFHVRELGYYNPHLIVFHGFQEDGSRVQLVQHISQISFVLMTLRRKDPEQPKRPFGFAAAHDQVASE